MLGDDASAAPPIKGVCRSASIALRKANLAKETGDAEEELAQLRSFNRTIANVLRLHPMYPRKKQDEEVAGLDAKLPEVRRRIEALGGKVAPPPEPIAEAAASAMGSGGGATLPPSASMRRRTSGSLASRPATSSSCFFLGYIGCRRSTFAMVRLNDRSCASSSSASPVSFARLALRRAMLAERHTPLMGGAALASSPSIAARTRARNADSRPGGRDARGARDGRGAKCAGATATGLRD